MSSRQQHATDVSQELEEEEAISITREGDEIMEEVEEQDGYSMFISCLYDQPVSLWSFIYGGHTKPI